MQKTAMKAFLFGISLLLLAAPSLGKLTQAEKCGACLSMIEEINHQINTADQKKKIKVGNFRIDAHGNQPNIREVAYARSEENLMEVFENICDKFYNHAKHKPEGATRDLFIRSNSRDHDVSYSSVGIIGDSDLGKRLTRACHDILEDHEEEFMLLFNKDESEDAETKLCQEMTELCSPEDVSEKRDFLSKEDELIKKAQAAEEKQLKEDEEREKKEEEERKKKEEEEKEKKGEDSDEEDDSEEDSKDEDDSKSKESEENDSKSDESSEEKKDEL